MSKPVPINLISEKPVFVMGKKKLYEISGYALQNKKTWF
jgi:hypothetical protein